MKSFCKIRAVSTVLTTMLLLITCAVMSGCEATDSSLTGENGTIFDPGCMSECAAAGGTNAQCELRCGQEDQNDNTGKDSEASEKCWDECSKSGAPKAACAERCDRPDESKEQSICLQECIAKKGKGAMDECREYCYEDRSDKDEWDKGDKGDK
ncbi:MAG TPA: hypothetical protein DCQ06_03455, partial [Myxococcales bacterium]|nr:hypothetical protein [Myxococcales bacterium]